VEEGPTDAIADSSEKSEVKSGKIAMEAAFSILFV
jgi:hypothetical protein